MKACCAPQQECKQEEISCHEHFRYSLEKKDEK